MKKEKPRIKPQKEQALMQVSKTNIIVQHNNLINCMFHMNNVEMECFIYMLASINEGDTKFREVQIPISYLTDTKGGSTYANMKKQIGHLMSKRLEVEVIELSQNKGDKLNPVYTTINIYSKMTHKVGWNYIETEFNAGAAPYLLNITSNFTKSQLKYMLLLNRNPYAFKVYWLLKQYLDYGGRKFNLQELRALLALVGVNEEGKPWDTYNTWDNFRRHLIEPVKLILAKTDMAFEYSTTMKSKSSDFENHDINFRLTGNMSN